MIAHLQGKLVEKNPTQVVIDCGGVGYHVNISLHTYSLLPATDFIKWDEALSALEVLGFVRKTSERIVEKIIKEDPDSSLESIIKRALKIL